MTPKEQMIDEITRTDGRKAKKTLEPYAIGRWVSVEERFPDDFCDLYVKDNGDACVAFYDPEDNRFYTSEYSALHDVTHWLELDLPGGAESNTWNSFSVRFGFLLVFASLAKPF